MSRSVCAGGVVAVASPPWRELRVTRLPPSRSGSAPFPPRSHRGTSPPTPHSSLHHPFSQIWDTAGQEKYHSLAPMYYRGAAAAILVYDITRNGSFDTLRNWVKELQTNGPAGIVLSVVGNKCDLAEQRAVPIAGAQEYAQDMGAEFFETSAKADTNVRDVFQGIAARLPPPGGDGGREEDVELGARSGGGDGKGGCPC